MQLAMRFLVVAALLILEAHGQVSAQESRESRSRLSYLTTAEPLTLLSANDGETRFLRTATGFEQACADDSFTVIQLGPNHPPITKTVAGQTPNTICGSPYIAITQDGRYGFVANHGWRDTLFVKDIQNAVPAEHLAQVLSVIDLRCKDPMVSDQVQLPGDCWMIDLHPDGDKVIVGVGSSLHIYRVQNRQLSRMARVQAPGPVFCFDVSPKGDNLILVTVETEDDVPVAQLHVLRIKGNSITHPRRLRAADGLGPIDKGFSPRISPDGETALVPHGFGIGGKGTLDDVLVVDLTLKRPAFTQRLRQVADGIESLAFHPSGEFAVICCLQTGLDRTKTSHLATVDLTKRPVRVLNYLPIEPVPEGIEFSPDRTQLFVQTTFANHIVVFRVDGMNLIREPFVLPTGYGPSSLAISRRWTDSTCCGGG